MEMFRWLLPRLWHGADAADAAVTFARRPTVGNGVRFTFRLLGLAWSAAFLADERPPTWHVAVASRREPSRCSSAPFKSAAARRRDRDRGPGSGHRLS